MLMSAMAQRAHAEEPTTDYYISGVTGDYNVGTYEGGDDIAAHCVIFFNTLDRCMANWGSRPGTPVIQLGSSASPLPVKSGASLIPATYTGAVNFELNNTAGYGFAVNSGTVTLRNFTLRNNGKPTASNSFDFITVSAGSTLNIGDGTDITLDAASVPSCYAINNKGTVSIGGKVTVSINQYKTVILNSTGICSIGGNAGDEISIVSLNGRGIDNTGGAVLSVGAGASISSHTGILNQTGSTVTVTGGLIEGASCGVNNYATLNIDGGTITSGSGVAVINYSTGDLNMTGGQVLYTGASFYPALINEGTAGISGGVISSSGSYAVSTYNKLTLNGSVIVTAPNGKAVFSDINTIDNSEIVIGGSAKISSKDTALTAAKPKSGTSKLTVSGGEITSGSTAVSTDTDTTITGGKFTASGNNNIYALNSSGSATVEISNGEFYASGNIDVSAYLSSGSAAITITGGKFTGVGSTGNIRALRCSGGATVTINGGEFTGRGPGAVGIYNSGCDITVTNGSITGISTTKSVQGFGIYSVAAGDPPTQARLTISGGTITGESSDGTANTMSYGLCNNGTITTITGGTIISKGTGSTSSAIFDMYSYTSNNLSIGGTAVLKSASPYTIHYEKRRSDCSFSYFGTVFYSHPYVDLKIQGVYDEFSSYYIIDSARYTGTQARGLADGGYDVAAWTRDAAKKNILSTTNPAPVSSLAGGSVYPDVRPVYPITVNQGGHGTAGANPTGAFEGKTVTLTAAPNTGYSFDYWSSSPAVAFGNPSSENTTFSMPASAVTVTANWKANKYTVNLNPGAGSVSPSSTDVAYDSADALPVPTRTGYTFLGWYTAENGTGAKVTDDAGVPSGTAAGCVAAGKWSLTSTVTLYARWSANNYTVKFDPRGGSVSTKSKTVTYDSPYGGLPVPERTGYTFGGWWTGTGGTGTKVTPATTVSVTTEQTLYAAWTANVYTVNFDACGGTVPEESRNVTYDSPYGELPAPERTGYTFAGWRTGAGGTGIKVTAATIVSITTEQTLYADWTANKYDVNLFPNGGTCETPAHVTYDSGEALPVPTLAGHTFTGWYSFEGGAGGGFTPDDRITDSAGMPTGTVEGYVRDGKWSLTAEISVCAVWTVNTYTLCFGSDAGAVTAVYDTAITLPAPTRANHIFDGWYESETDGNGSGVKFEAAKMPDLGADGTAKTLYAKWTPKVTVSYAPSAQSYTYGTAGASFAVSHELAGFDAYYFVDSIWTKTPPVNAGSYDVRITRGEDAVYASYDSGVLEDCFIITPAPLTVSVRIGLNISKIYDGSTAVNDVESGWLAVEGLKNGETATASGTWAYSGADAGSGKTVNITVITINYITADPSNYAYTPADLWTTGTVFEAPQPVTDVMIDYAAETLTTDSLMEYSADGSDWEDCSADMAIGSGRFGSVLYIRHKAKPNYLAGDVQTLTIPARPATPAATGTPETYFAQCNGTISGVNDAMEYRCGADGEWQSVSGGTMENLAAGTYRIRVKATESSFRSDEQVIMIEPGEKLAVSFDPQGGSAVGTITGLAYNDAIAAPSPAPARTGHTFAGWYTDSGCTNAWDFAADRLTGHTTLYAKWLINMHTVSFDANGGAAVPSQTVPYGSTASMPVPVKIGFAFFGWYTDRALTAEYSFAAPVTKDITLYAKWAAYPYDRTAPQQHNAIAVTVVETTAALFGDDVQISVSADTAAFNSSVDVRITESQHGMKSFGLAAVDEIYPFDISLYVKGTNQKTNPAEGCTVTVTLPVPASLMDVMDRIAVVHMAADGTVTTLASKLGQKDGEWFITFEASEFSPFALVVRRTGDYDSAAGVPYYTDGSGAKVYIGFAAEGRYIAPDGVIVRMKRNDKRFADVARHWAESYIRFVTERELFLGTGGDAFSPNAVMSRTMFATVIGRLYERSYGAIAPSETHAFTDCDYAAYYGKYVDWAADNNIMGGVGDGSFDPSAPITREQIAVVLYRLADYLGALLDDAGDAPEYVDEASIPGYAKDAARFCRSTGIIGGRDGGVFAPKETATRAEVATMIERFVKVVLG